MASSSKIGAENPQLLVDCLHVGLVHGDVTGEVQDKVFVLENHHLSPEEMKSLCALARRCFFRVSDECEGRDLPGQICIHIGAVHKMPVDILRANLYFSQFPERGSDERGLFHLAMQTTPGNCNFLFTGCQMQNDIVERVPVPIQNVNGDTADMRSLVNMCRNTNDAVRELTAGMENRLLRLENGILKLENGVLSSGRSGKFREFAEGAKSLCQCALYIGGCVAAITVARKINIPVNINVGKVADFHALHLKIGSILSPIFGKKKTNEK